MGAVPSPSRASRQPRAPRATRAPRPAVDAEVKAKLDALREDVFYFNPNDGPLPYGLKQKWLTWIDELRVLLLAEPKATKQ